jgi:uncharacterized protein
MTGTTITSDVQTHRVMVPSSGTALVGRVYRRPGTGVFDRQPTVLVTGSWLNVKEQMAHVYATALAQRGFTAVTFDFAGWGESGGELRQLEWPSRKIEDITTAARFVGQLAFAQPGGVGYLGVCASAQYALTAVAQGAPIRSLASVAGWFHDTTTVAPFYGGASGVEARLQRAEAAISRYLDTGEVVTVPAYDQGNETAGMFIEMDYYANPARGAVPEWRNEMAEMSWLGWLTFDGLSVAGTADVPALFVHSDGCVFPDNIARLRRNLPGPVEVAWGEGLQTDFYDQPAQVAFALDALESHFTTTLT